jgi:hypothetical protein
LRQEYTKKKNLSREIFCFCKKFLMMIYPGTGTEFYRPLAVAVIFGLAFATALTLVVVPVVVWVMERGKG